MRFKRLVVTSRPGLETRVDSDGRTKPMKKCPTCDKTFEDSMRFCQVDGTSLVDDEPAFDPFATMVAKPGDLKAAKEEVKPEEPPVEAAEPQPEEAPPIAEPDELLDLPEADPLRTMYVSDAEMQELVGQSPAGAPEIVETPPAEEPVSSPSSFEPPPSPEPPSFNVPDVPAPSFGDMAPPPSPLSAAESFAEEKQFEPERFNEAQTIYQSPMNMPLDPAPAPPAEWTPPPAPDASWQNKEIDANTPFQPPVAVPDGVNKTLPIVSLVLGIISLCCYISPITGLVAVITGYLGMRNANNDPNNYGGKGLAIAGMITGGLLFLVGIAYWIFVIFFGGLAMMMNAVG